jgi:hypothetical protein
MNQARQQEIHDRQGQHHKTRARCHRRQ